MNPGVNEVFRRVQVFGLGPAGSLSNQISVTPFVNESRLGDNGQSGICDISRHFRWALRCVFKPMS